MLATILALHVALQASPPQQTTRPTTVRDSTPADSAPRNARRRLPVTVALRASAFHDVGARDLFDRAQQRRIAQDSSLNSYDATVKQRISVQLGIGKASPERLFYRQESAARVQWQRGAGVHIDVTGARVAIPVIASPKDERDAVQGVAADRDAIPIPYYPGAETMWIGDLTAERDVNDLGMVHPLANGAEAYYTFETGDSVSMRLPDGRTIQLRELKVRPRAAQANLAVGSLWIDAASGHLVRAAYRLAVPATIRIGVENGDSTSKGAKRMSFIMRSLISPMTAELSAVVVEYGLYGGAFWLPRSQAMEGKAQATLARVPIKLENAFSYASVNTPLGLTDVVVDTTNRMPRLDRPPEGLDSAAQRRWRDSVRVASRALRNARADSIKQGMRVGSMRQCDTSSTRVLTAYRSDARVPVVVRVPCDTDKLLTSADLPASIYAPGEETFGNLTDNPLVASALRMSAQAPLSLGNLPAPRWQFGPSMTRYNRVEGLSTGILIEQQLGGGYSTMGIARFGFADHWPNAELSLARSNLDKTIRLTGYNRLVSANDWGTPLTFTSSLSAFLFGRDEGFYYRATGADLQWTTERGVRLDWRAFAERQRSAALQTTWSLGPTFMPNVDAAALTSYGGGVRFLNAYGQNPRTLRAFTDLRVEGAGGDSTYGRAALDVTVSRGLVGRLEGALTLAGGTSVGEVPAQRRWYLGGTHTIRGQSPDTAQSGNAFWITRAELARSQVGMRTSLFGDLGWVGDRERMSDINRPMSGVGVGVSFLDGLVRLDVARGLYPREQTRVSFYFGAKF